MKENEQKLTLRDETSEFLLYSTDAGTIKVEVLLGEETVWLTINRMAELFGVDKSSISRHLKNIYESGELDREATVAKIATVQIEGEREVTRPLEYYNLDAIISVGYRVNSPQATQFRIWATKLLREYLIKGFTLDDDRLKNGRFFGKDYFRELLERVRSIRASERRQSFTMDGFSTSVNKFLTFTNTKYSKIWFYQTHQSRIQGHFRI